MIGGLVEVHQRVIIWKKNPVPSFCAPHPNISIETQVNLCVPDFVEAQEYGWTSYTFCSQGGRSSIYKPSCFTPQPKSRLMVWHLIQLREREREKSTPTPSRSLRALWGPLSEVEIIGTGISPQKRPKKKGRRRKTRRGASWVISMSTIENKCDGEFRRTSVSRSIWQNAKHGRRKSVRGVQSAGSNGNWLVGRPERKRGVGSKCSYSTGDRKSPSDSQENEMLGGRKSKGNFYLVTCAARITIKRKISVVKHHPDDYWDEEKNLSWFFTNILAWEDEFCERTQNDMTAMLRKPNMEDVRGTCMSARVKIKSSFC